MSNPIRWTSAVAFACLVCFASSPVRGEGHHAVSRAGDHAPIGVMGEHPHHKGRLMLSYRYARMHMDGNRDGTRSLSPAQVLATGYLVSPTDMDVNMHMFGIMAAPTDWVTLTAMVPYVTKEMNHLTGMGATFETRSSGVGDFRLGSLWPLLKGDIHELLFSAGLSFPTGSIQKKDFTPMGFQQLPYPMQLGTGTYDVLLGATYKGVAGSATWGSQIAGEVRTGTNDRSYTVGDRYHITGWVMWDWTRWMGTSLRLDWQQWFNYDGADPSLNPAVVPTADPQLRAGRQLDILVGANFVLPFARKLLKNQRLAIEAGFRHYRHLDGPQLERDWRLIVGWQYDFHAF